MNFPTTTPYYFKWLTPLPILMQNHSGGDRVTLGSAYSLPVHMPNYSEDVHYWNWRARADLPALQTGLQTRLAVTDSTCRDFDPSQYFFGDHSLLSCSTTLGFAHRITTQADVAMLVLFSDFTRHFRPAIMQCWGLESPPLAPSSQHCVAATPSLRQV